MFEKAILKEEGGGELEEGCEEGEMRKLEEGGGLEEGWEKGVLDERESFEFLGSELGREERCIFFI